MNYAVTPHYSNASEGALLEIDGLGLVRNGEAHVFSDSEWETWVEKNPTWEKWTQLEVEEFDEGEPDEQIERPQPVVPEEDAQVQDEEVAEEEEPEAPEAPKEVNKND